MIRTESVRTQVKQQLIEAVDSLSYERVQQLLDFAAFLKQRSDTIPEPKLGTEEVSLDAWEESLRNTEAYWFSLPESVRSSYKGKVVALLKDQIVDSDEQLRTLKERVRKNLADQPVLYVEADAELLPPLTIRSPKLR